MKPTFKTTAVAILAALGVSACSNHSDDDVAPANQSQVVNPTAPTNNESTTTNDNAGTTTNDNAGTTTNDNAGANTNNNAGANTNNNSGTTTNNNAGTTTNNNSGNTTNDNTGTNNNTSTTPSNPLTPVEPKEPVDPKEPVTPPTPSNKPEVLGGTWRYVELGTLSNQDDFVQPILGGGDDGFVGSGRIDLNALANGKSGTIEGVASGEELFVGSKQQTNGVKVIFENKPYSTYGFVTLKDENNLDKPAYFAFINADKEGEHSTQAARNVYRKMQERGNAVYEGNVYATINKQSSVEDNFKDNWSAPALDGKVKMSVYVDGNAAKTMRNRGEITSNALNGTITLTSATVSQYDDAVTSAGNAMFNSKQGLYNVEYSSNEAKEMIGSVKLKLEQDNTKFDGEKITEYKAVFGGTADK